MNAKINYLSKQLQAEIMPNSTAVKYHNASFNKNSENRNWLVDVSYHENKKDTFYFLLNIHEKINSKRCCKEFTSKKQALEFIEAVNGKLTKYDKNYKPRKLKQDNQGVWRFEYFRMKKNKKQLSKAMQNDIENMRSNFRNIVKKLKL